MEKENDNKTPNTDRPLPEISKKQFTVADFENFLNKLPSDNPRIQLLKRMYAYKVTLNKFRQEKQDS